MQEYPTTADASIRNLPVERVLQVVRQTDIPAKGNLSGTAHFMGTLDNPQGSADVDLASAVIYDEPLDHVRARVAYLAGSIDAQQLQIVSGPSEIDLTARYDHPAGKRQQGKIQVRMNNSRNDQARIKHVQEQRPGLGGILQIAGSGDAEIHEKDPRVAIRDLNANLNANGLTAQGKKLGDATLTANTSGGKLNFTMDSNLASAAIHGSGNAQLNADYPIDAQLTFRNITWSRVQDLLGFQQRRATRIRSCNGRSSVGARSSSQNRCDDRYAPDHASRSEQHSAGRDALRASHRVSESRSDLRLSRSRSGSHR